MRSGGGPDLAKRKARQGSAAIEFAMVSIPFFFMMFALLEVGLLLILDATLESAVSQTGRMVRTGEAASRGFTSAQFKTELCDRMTIFSGDCDARAFVDVREIVAFDTDDVPDPMQDGELNGADDFYQNGVAGSLMLVRVWYSHPVFTPLMERMLKRTNDNKTVLVAATTFRNEPYGPMVVPSGGG